MASISELHDDILSSIFNWLSAGRLVVAAHVCRRWRLLALEHRNFWGQATIHGPLDFRSELDFFLARLSRSQDGRRPIAIVVEPNRFRHPLPPWTTRQVLTIQDRIIPALSAALSHMAALTLAVPAELANVLFDALRQPAPALRRFALTNRPQQTPMLLPQDIFASHAPALVELVVKGNIVFPTKRVPTAFRGVQTLELLEGRTTSEISVSDILVVFSNMHRFNTHRCRIASLGPLNQQQLDRLGRLDSLGIDGCLLNAMRLSDVAYESIVTIRRLDLDCIDQLLSYQFITDNRVLPLIMPQSSQELYCWIKPRRMCLTFPSGSGPPFVRTLQGAMTEPVHQGRIWAEVCAYPALVTLAVDIAVLTTLRSHGPAFPALEALLVTLGSQLPHYVTLDRPAPCPRLRTVLFQNRMYRGKSLQRAVVTCRGTDDFLRTSFAVGDWAALDVVLTDVTLDGDAKVAGTRISGVRTASKQECAGLGPRVAILLDDAEMQAMV